MKTVRENEEKEVSCEIVKKKTEYSENFPGISLIPQTVTGSKSLPGEYINKYLL